MRCVGVCGVVCGCVGVVCGGVWGWWLGVCGVGGLGVGGGLGWVRCGVFAVISFDCFRWMCVTQMVLTHWGRATHICVGKPTIIDSNNGLSPGRCLAIIWTNAWILSIRLLGTKVSEILIGNQTFSFKKMHLNKSSAKWRPVRLGLNVSLKQDCSPGIR